MAAATVVIEAALGSGSLITADFALEEGRDVFAMPGSIFAETSKGTNRLLQMGAMALTDTDDILQVFEHRGWLIPTAAEGGEEIDFDETERQVLAALSMERAIPAEDFDADDRPAASQIAAHPPSTATKKSRARNCPAAIFAALRQLFGYSFEI